MKKPNQLPIDPKTPAPVGLHAVVRHPGFKCNVGEHNVNFLSKWLADRQARNGIPKSLRTYKDKDTGFMMCETEYENGEKSVSLA